MSPCELNPCNEFEICHEYGGIGFYYCLCPADQTDYFSCRKTFDNSNYYASYWINMPEDSSRTILVLIILFVFNSAFFAYLFRFLLITYR